MSEECIFCRIISGDIPSDRLGENEHAIAIRDVNPQAPLHFLVMTKVHVGGLLALSYSDHAWQYLIGLVQQVAQSQHVEQGFRVVINQGEHGGQTVPHLHLHVLGKRAMGWPPG